MDKHTKTNEKPQVRNGRVVFYLTQDDHAELTKMAKKLGLNRSSFMTSIVERLIVGGFSPLVGAKLCFQLQRRYQSLGHSANSLYFGIRPLPPLPEEEIGNSEAKALLADIKNDLKPC